MKGKKTNLRHADCAIARALQATGDWWSLLIVRDAIAGKQRFGEFQKSSRVGEEYPFDTTQEVGGGGDLPD